MALADKTEQKTAALIEGLEKEKMIKVDAWVEHCKGRVEVLGWPRAQMMLKVNERTWLYPHAPLAHASDLICAHMYLYTHAPICCPGDRGAPREGC